MRSAATLEMRADRRRPIAALFADARGRQFLVDLTNQALRVGLRARAARRLHYLVAERGVPEFAPGLDCLALLSGARLADVAPWVVMPAATARLRHEFAPVVLPAVERRLGRHIRGRRRSPSCSAARRWTTSR